jgi:hypothetical protein
VHRLHYLRLGARMRPHPGQPLAQREAADSHDLSPGARSCSAHGPPTRPSGRPWPTRSARAARPAPLGRDAAPLDGGVRAGTAGAAHRKGPERFRMGRDPGRRAARMGVPQRTVFLAHGAPPLDVPAQGRNAREAPHSWALHPTAPPGPSFSASRRRPGPSVFLSRRRRHPDITMRPSSARRRATFLH